MKKLAPIFVLFLAAFLILRVIQYGWVTDDAFITFKSVLNFVGGDGPVFNIGERVQSFTHPLWFLFLSFGGLLDINLFFFSILLGVFFSLALLLVIFKLGANGNNIAVALLFLAASESFVTFSTSGLENSLTHLLIALTIYFFLSNYSRLYLYVSISLAIMNRFDVVFILSPVLIFILFSEIRDRKLKYNQLMIGFSPLFVWHLFSLLYYGFLFPNTKYAKIGGRDIVANISSGVDYTFDAIQSEPHVFVVFLILFVFIVINVLKERALYFTVKENQAIALLFFGVFLQGAYVIGVAGGDFMRGRFYTTTVVSMALIIVLIKPIKLTFARSSLVLLLFSISAWVGSQEKIRFPAAGVANERNFYKKHLALNISPTNSYYYHPWAVSARELGANGGAVIGMNGQRAYWIPRQIALIDLAGLSDPFIARLPVLKSDRTGHFERIVPDEYLSIRANNLELTGWKDKKAEELYINIKLITMSQEIFSGQRLRAMFWAWRNYGI